MKNKVTFTGSTFVALLLALALTLGPAQAQEIAPQGGAVIQAELGTAFTYQGRLTDGGSPANGTYDMRFRLYDALSGGVQVGPDANRNNVAVNDGLFTVMVDFANMFNGRALWLQVEVRPGGGSYTTLSPRQPITAAPYASSLRPGARIRGEVVEGPVLTVENTSSESQSTGLYGFANVPNGVVYGVYGRSPSTSGRGVYGWATATSGTTYGVLGRSSSSTGAGVRGLNDATSGTTYGVRGETASPAGIGVYGLAGAIGTGSVGTGVLGESVGVAGRGVTGLVSGANGVGIYGNASHASGANYALYAVTSSANGYAGYFNGRVHVVGTLSKSAGSFIIDHPLDPANQYLYHSFVESPDMKNIYDGVVSLDAAGTAHVELPVWFEALNQDFRYQLTPIGAAMPNLHIAQEIAGNTFKIGGGEPGMKVSWQVTGIRHDPYAEAHRIPVEQEKPADERGTYLYPELYDQPAEMGLHYELSRIGLEP